MVVTRPAGSAHTMILSPSELCFSLSSRIIRGQKPAATDEELKADKIYQLPESCAANARRSKTILSKEKSFFQGRQRHLLTPSTGYGELQILVLLLLFEAGEQEKRCWN